MRANGTLQQLNVDGTIQAIVNESRSQPSILRLYCVENSVIPFRVYLKVLQIFVTYLQMSLTDAFDMSLTVTFLYLYLKRSLAGQLETQ